MANFRVDTKLASLLGENYPSTEKALKELVDNAWDADAENVWINLPDSMTDQPIIIEDDGDGMTPSEIESEYLFIANDRHSRKGEKTPRKERLVKGRKGIGKFAGLAAAEKMEISTKSNSEKTYLCIRKSELLKDREDIERVNLPMETSSCSIDERGTIITLSNLNQNLSFPNPAVMRKILVLEYGRETDFLIHVNDLPLQQEDLPGEQFIEETELPEAGNLKLKFTVMEKQAKKKQAGISMRIGGKIVGQPSLMGLDECEDIPKKLLKRIVGEIEADSLENVVTADWGSLIENSKACQETREWTREKLQKHVRKVYANEINLTKARHQKEINKRLSQLPEYRRQFANDALEKVLKRFYGETEGKQEILISLILEALEKDEYWTVCQTIESAKHSDVITFAEALESFGLLEMALIAQQAKRRMDFLNALDDLSSKSDTLEKDMHKALETNLWVFGTKYSLMASNKALKTIIREYTGKKYKGENEDKRPDLLLSQDFSSQKLLIEFKRPKEKVGRQAEAQAKEYRDDLTQSHGIMDIIVIGGEVDSKISPLYEQKDIKFLSYKSLISDAMSQLEWLIQEMTMNAF